MKGTDFEKGDYGSAKWPACSPSFKRCYRKRDYDERIMSDRSPFSLCQSGKKAERWQKRRSKQEKRDYEQGKRHFCSPLFAKQWKQRQQNTMAAGGKAQSAPFCLVSTPCHGAEGKSRADRNLGSENRRAIGREKDRI